MCSLIVTGRAAGAAGRAHQGELLCVGPIVSSGEAELYAVVRGATEALGMMTLAKDLGRKVGVQLQVDAIAAKGMIERRGLSKVRHLDVNVLWLQEQCARNVLPITKVAGEANPADLMTKYLVRDKVVARMSKLKQARREGRAKMGLELQGNK